MAESCQAMPGLKQALIVRKESARTRIPSFNQKRLKST
jgi:hypothetical protein